MEDRAEQALIARAKGGDRVAYEHLLEPAISLSYKACVCNVARPGDQGQQILTAERPTALHDGG